MASTPSTTVTSASGRHAALAAAGSPITVDDLRTHTSTWGDPIGIDYRGVRATSHPPNSSGVVALEILGILAQFDPPAAGAFGPAGVADADWIHLGLEASKLALADRDAYLTDPDDRDVPVAELLDPQRLASLAARIDRERAARPAAATNPPGGGTIFLATVDRRRQCCQPDRVELGRVRLGRGRSGHRDPLPEPGQLLQPRRGSRQRHRPSQADAPHAAPRDAVP